MTSLWQTEAAQHLLALREILVRHDENWKAHVLMDQCVPYVCAERRDVQQAAEDQAAMVMHAIDAAAGKEYYDNNPGDRPFEQQYGLTSAAQIFQGLPRFDYTRKHLHRDNGTFPARILDLACNDGILAAALRETGRNDVVSGLDLSQPCIDRAIARETPGTEYRCGSILDVASIYEPDSYRLVVMFEVLEHVLHPEQFLAAAWAMVGTDGTLLVSTPNGAVERGELPAWDVVEPKGHIWAFTAQEFHDMLTALGGSDVQMGIGPDGVLIGQVTR